MLEDEKTPISDMEKIRSNCPINIALEIMGDRWTVLILRDMVMGKSKYKELHEGFEGIPTNILASRLKKMIQDGLIEKKIYQDRPTRYEYHLTKKGRGFIPILKELATWALKNYQGCWQPPEAFWDLK